MLRTVNGTGCTSPGWQIKGNMNVFDFYNCWIFKTHNLVCFSITLQIYHCNKICKCSYVSCVSCFSTCLEFCIHFCCYIRFNPFLIVCSYLYAFLIMHAIGKLQMKRNRKHTIHIFAHIFPNGCVSPEGWTHWRAHVLTEEPHYKI